MSGNPGINHCLPPATLHAVYNSLIQWFTLLILPLTIACSVLWGRSPIGYQAEPPPLGHYSEHLCNCRIVNCRTSVAASPYPYNLHLILLHFIFDVGNISYMLLTEPLTPFVSSQFSLLRSAKQYFTFHCKGIPFRPVRRAVIAQNDLCDFLSLRALLIIA